MCAIWHSISYTVYGHGVKFGIRCACPSDSFKPDMDSLKWMCLSVRFVQPSSLISQPPSKRHWVKLGRGMIVVLGPLSAMALGSS
jgi:hypothetical protein